MTFPEGHPAEHLRWPDHYREPASHVARSVQYPLDSRFAERMVNAHARDEREKRKQRIEPT